MSQSHRMRKPTLSSERVPDEVVFDILTHLPVKPIIRFRCVSKSWNSTITTPIFITTHLNHNRAKSSVPNNDYLLYTSRAMHPSTHQQLCAVVRNSDHTLTELSRCRSPFCGSNVIGFCNGIYCFFENNNYTISLWNPSIKKLKILTPVRIPRYDGMVTHGLVYNSLNNDFKILRIVFDGEVSGYKVPLPLEAGVYTWSTDSWRYIDIYMESLSGSGLNASIVDIQEKPFIFVNGALHSMIHTRGHNFILCFDVNDETFQAIMLPENYLDGLSPDFDQFEQLVVFKGSLALVAFGRDLYEEHDLCFIWVMMEYGMFDSWTKKTVAVDLVERFFGCTRRGELLIETLDTGLVSFDPDSLDQKNLEIQRSPIWLGYSTDFMESLVLLDGVNLSSESLVLLDEDLASS
ncbi:hypothetical protein ACB092_09G181900 [Castanea dentata]